MRARSRKTAKLYRQHRIPLVRALFEDAQICQFPGCTSVASDPHEPITRGRGGSIVDPTNVVALCTYHNQNIQHPGFREVAENAGLLKSAGANRHTFIPDEIGYYCQRCTLPRMNWRHREDAA